MEDYGERPSFWVASTVKRILGRRQAGEFDDETCWRCRALTRRERQFERVDLSGQRASWTRVEGGRRRDAPQIEVTVTCPV